MSDKKDQKKGFSPGEETPLPFEKEVQENFHSYYLFHEVFSDPVCRKMYPLLRSYPWKPLSLRRYL